MSFRFELSRESGRIAAGLISIVLALSAAMPARADTAAFVISTSAETMSRIDLNTGALTPDLLTLGSDLGSAPNQVVIHDTLACVVASVTDEIQVINLKSMTTSRYIDLPTGSNPYWMEFYDRRFAWISLLVDNAVARVDMVSGSVVNSIPVGKSPQGIAICDHKLYVANTGFDFGTFQYDPGTVSVIDLRSGSLVTTIPVGLNPQYLAVDNQQLVHVVCTGNFFSVFGVIYRLDGVSATVVDSIAIGGSPGQIAIGPNDLAFVAAGGFTDSGMVYTYDARSGTVYHGEGNPIRVDYGCLGMGVFQDTSAFALTFDNTVIRIDSAGDRLDSWNVSEGPAHMTFRYLTGDVNGDFVVDISDVTALVDFLFLSFARPAWPSWRANTDGNFDVDISDLTRLVNHLFISGEPLLPGPQWIR